MDEGIRWPMDFDRKPGRGPNLMHLSHAREGRSALWMHLPEESNVRKTLRVLAGHPYVHSRYYGANSMYDVRLP